MTDEKDNLAITDAEEKELVAAGLMRLPLDKKTTIF